MEFKNVLIKSINAELENVNNKLSDAVFNRDFHKVKDLGKQLDRLNDVMDYVEKKLK